MTTYSAVIECLWLWTNGGLGTIATIPFGRDRHIPNAKRGGKWRFCGPCDIEGRTG